MSGIGCTHEKKREKAFGAGDTAFASQVSALWSIWEEAQPDFEPVERLEGQVFSLAAANQLKEAWRAACQREDAQPASPLLAYTMVRIASRLGLIDQSLQWLNFGLGSLRRSTSLCAGRIRISKICDHRRRRNSVERQLCSVSSSLIVSGFAIA
jgi:hypothetical protein